MKAILIQPAEKTIEPVEVSSVDEIIQLIGYDTVIADEVGNSKDKLYFDEECFLRGAEGRFQLDTLIPVSGIGVIVGGSDDSLADHESDIDDIRSRVKFTA